MRIEFPIGSNASELLIASGLINSNKPARLHLGCGENYFEGYINIDYPPNEHSIQTNVVADVLADVKTLRFISQTIDEIRLHHVFEHFDRAEAMALLIRWHEWLKVDGVLHIETPDILGCAQALISHGSYVEKQAILRHAFGSHEAKWAHHLDGWYDEKFIRVLSALGFSVKVRYWKWKESPHLPNIDVTAIKKKNLNRIELVSTAEGILSESMVKAVASESNLLSVWKQAMLSLLDDKVPCE